MRFSVDQIGEQICIDLWGSRQLVSDRQLKRSFDLFLALVGLLFLAPLLLLIALTVKLSSPGPVLFRQKRYGLDGKCFWVYKFRSMRVLEDGDQPGLGRPPATILALLQLVLFCDAGVWTNFHSCLM